MSTDPFGPGSPFGDKSKQPKSSPEDFLGLDGGEDEADSQSALEEETSDAPILSSPTEEDFGAYEPSAGNPLDVEESFEDFNDFEDSNSTEPLQALSTLDSLGDLPLDPGDDVDSLDLDFDGSEHLDATEDDDGWLMEFEVAEDEPISEPFAEVGASVADAEGDLSEDHDLQPALAEASAPWLSRALIAALSVFLGVVGAKFIPFGDSPSEVRPRVAQNQPNNPGQGAPTPKGQTPTPPVVTPEPVVAQRDPLIETPVTDPVIESPIVETIPPVQPELTVSQGPEPGSSTESAIEIDWQATGETGNWGRESRTQVVPIEDMPLMPSDGGVRLRQATAGELASIWTESAIPLDAIMKDARLLTPNVGRVRVVLADGEIFEGQLYAVGNKRVWIDTTLGKMALLEWQIDRVEHILTSQGSAVLGSDGSQDLAGLKSVRVSTAGGVFYGKLLSRDGNQVTLVTEAGARITLNDAQVDSAGRSATHLVDATGVVDDPEPEPKPK